MSCSKARPGALAPIVAALALALAAITPGTALALDETLAAGAPAQAQAAAGPAAEVTDGPAGEAEADPDEAADPDGGEAASPGEGEPAAEGEPAEALPAEGESAPAPEEPAADAAEPAEALPAEGEPAPGDAEPLAAAAEPAPVADGEYWIESGVAAREVLDVSGGSAKPGANVQTWSSNKSGAQRWRVSLDLESGLYRVINAVSGLALDVSGAVARSGRNVVAYSDNGTLAQRWRIVGDEIGGFELVSALSDSLALDVAGASARDGANVQVWARNGSAAQRFWFVPTAGVAGGEAVLPDGAYTVSVGGVALDVAGGSQASGANVQSYAPNGTPAQTWVLTYSDGYYTVQSAGSGNALDVAGARVVPGSNVQAYAPNGTDAQRWRVDAVEGGYRLVNKASGLVLDLAGNKRANGTNVDVWRGNGTSAQAWSIEPAPLLSEGYFEFASGKPSGAVLDVRSGSHDAGAAVQLYSSNGSGAQKWAVRGFGDGTYELRNIGSGLWLAPDGKGGVVQSGERAAWEAAWTGTGVALVRDGAAVSASSASSGAALSTRPFASSAGQSFIPRSVALLADGFYVIETQGSGLALDVAGANTRRGANVDVYSKNGTAAQVFSVTRNADGTYTLINDISGLALDVAAASKADGANVQQYTPNGSAAQRWRLSWEDGGFVFTNVASGRRLSAEGAAPGANVSSSASGSSAWLLAKTSPVRSSGDVALDRMVKEIIARCGTGYSGLKNAYVYVSRNFTYRHGNSYPGGNWTSWSKSYAKEMYTNRSGNCYRYASLMTWVARGLGYSAQAVSGELKGWTRWVAHGWTTVTLNGGVYVIDCEMAYEYPQIDNFMHTYDKTPEIYRLIN